MPIFMEVSYVEGERREGEGGGGREKWRGAGERKGREGEAEEGVLRGLPLPLVSTIWSGLFYHSQILLFLSLSLSPLTIRHHFFLL